MKHEVGKRRNRKSRKRKSRMNKKEEKEGGKRRVESLNTKNESDG